MKSWILALLTLAVISPPARAADEPSSRDISRYKRALAVYLKDEDKRELESLIVKLGEVDHPKVVTMIPIAGVGIASQEVYDAARKAIAGLQNDEAVAELVSMLGKTKPTAFQQGVLILDGFAGRKDETSLAGVVDALTHKLPAIQRAAIRAAAARRQKAPVDGLIEIVARFEKLRDLLWIEARQALVTITGQDFELAEDWKKFWDGARDTFDPEAVGKSSGATKVVVKKAKDSVEFFGEEIFSRNLVFVIDVSGSMLKYDESDDYDGKDLERDRERLARAKEQLKKALDLLPKAARFNIIAYNNTVKTWQKSLRPASSSAVANAKKFVDGFQARDATHTDEAIEKAFDDPNIDTIVLLSDGAPAKRDAESGFLIEKILGWVKDNNAGRKIRINTFGFEGAGEWPERVTKGQPQPIPRPSPDDIKAFTDFMKKLAEENEGVYRPVE